MNAPRRAGSRPPRPTARIPGERAEPSVSVVPQASLDATDLRILEELQNDARLTNVELAARIGLSPSPCLARVRAMEASGVIRGYVTLVDAAAVGCAVTAFVDVTLHDRRPATHESFEAAMRALPQVLEAHRIGGDVDYLLRVAVPDVAAFETFLGALDAVTGVGRVRSRFALRPVKSETALPLPERREPVRKAGSTGPPMRTLRRRSST
jgi:DNA-binding Lrp family transcriptional regulator